MRYYVGTLRTTEVSSMTTYDTVLLTRGVLILSAVIHGAARIDNTTGENGGYI